jgi:16S rRNA (uracil1498-N3)-methyltransferase
MRHTRFYTSQALTSTGSVELTGSASHYLTRVLRMSEGETVTLFNGDGWNYSGEINEVLRQRVSIKLVGRHKPNNEAGLKITLVQAISRGERMDYSLQKATELGVYCIQPLICRRVEVRLDEKRKAKRMAHWQGVVISASEQCGRARIPEITEPLFLQEWLHSAGDGLRLILDPEAKTSLSSVTVSNKAVSILVGPEGGFSDEEMEQAIGHGVTAVSLGPRVLRTESAGPAAIAVLQTIAGDF